MEKKPAMTLWAPHQNSLHKLMPQHFCDPEMTAHRFMISTVAVAKALYICYIVYDGM